MKTKLLLFSWILILFTACQSEKSEKASTATQKEQKAAPAVDPAKALLEYVNTHPDAHEENAKKLNEASKLYLGVNKYQSALACLNQAVRNHYTGSMTAENALSMATIYKEKYKKPNLAQVVYQSLGKTFGDNAAVQTALAANPVSIPAIGTFLDDLAGKLTNSETGKIEVQMANDFVAASELHAMLEPTDAENANYLHKAGEIARSMRAFPKAIDLYNWIYTKYPDSKKASQALFMSAFTMDNELKQVDKARALYEQFLKTYPNDDFADDTKFLLANLGKSNEEIIESFGNQ